MKIESLSDLERTLSSHSNVLVLYSGGIDGTFLLWWLSQRRLNRLVALTVNLGGDRFPSDMRETCLNLGAEWLLIEKKEEFADKYVAPSISAQAYYLCGHPICASLSRPLLAKVAVEVACSEKIDVLLHSSSITQNSLRRFNGAIERLGFTGIYGSPFELSLIPRAEKLRSLPSCHIRKENNELYSSDTNLWGREFESGNLDDPEDIRVPEKIFYWTTQTMPVESREMKITFERGLPTHIDGQTGDLSNLIAELQLTVGAYGIGRYIGLEEIGNGKKVQEIREMPAATLLYDAYRRLEAAILPAECIREKLHIEQIWVREAIEGRWFGILKESAQAFIANIAREVNGTIVYLLKAHMFTIRSITSPAACYLRSRDAGK